MREPKFRAWDKENNSWYEPTHEAYKGNLFELFVSFGGSLSAHTMEGMKHESIFPDRFIVMQYTGLKDRNDKEIYDGDILRCSDGKLRMIVWYDMGSGWRLGTDDDDTWFNGLAVFQKEQEVVGNYYENPELLETNE